MRIPAGKLKKVGMWAAVAVAVYTLLGFLAVPPILKNLLASRFSEVLDRDVSIERLRFNPYTLGIRAEDIAVADRAGEGTLGAIDALYLNLEASSLFRRALIFEEVVVEKPHLEIVRGPKGEYNLEHLLGPPGSSEKSRYSLNNIQITGGSLRFQDRMQDVEHLVRQITVQVPFISNIPSDVDIFVRPFFSAEVNGGHYEVSGKTKPFAESLETEMRVDAAGIELPRYAPYLPSGFDLKVVSGELTLNITLSYMWEKKSGPKFLVHGETAVKNLSVLGPKEKPLLHLPLLKAVIADSEIFDREFRISSLSVNSPRLNLTRQADGRVNVLSALPEWVSRPSPSEENGAAALLIIEEATLHDGRVALVDNMMQGPFTKVLEPLNIEIRHFSSRQDARAEFSLFAKTDDQEEVKAQGSFSAKPVSSEGQVGIRSLVLEKYRPYYDGLVEFEIEKGQVDLSSGYKYYNKEETPVLLLSALELTLSDARFREEGSQSSFLVIPSLSLSGGELNTADKRIVVGELSTEKGRVRIVRSPDGEVNLLTLFEGPPDQGHQETGAGIQEEDPPSWSFEVSRARAVEYAVHLEDRGEPGPVDLSLHDVALKAEGLSNKRGGRFSVSSIIEERGSLQAEGTLGIEPLEVSAKITAERIDLAPFHPYISESSNLAVTGGTFSAGGDLSLAQGEDALKFAYSGNLSVSDFESGNAATGNRLLAWKALDSDSVALSSNPVKIDVGEISVAGFYLRLVLQPDGTFNIQEMFKNKEKTGENGSSREDSPENAGEIRVGNLVLQEGTVDFTDQVIDPPYSATVAEVGGRMSTISSETREPAALEVTGKINGYAPLNLNGEIDFFRKDLYVDVRVNVNGMDLSPVSPYAAKYVGYTVERGKLTISAEYRVADRKIDSTNKVELDEFSLGEQVEGDPVVDLPVKFAVSLLKNRSGDIHIQVPITGNLQDPQFSFKDAIVQAVRRLLTRVVTAPFSFIGSLFAGGEHGEDLGYIEFDEGGSEISPRDRRKLDILVKALEDRPEIRLEISGYADPEEDREALVNERFVSLLKEQKRQELADRGISVPQEKIRIEPGEWARYFEGAYREAISPKAGSGAGSKRVPPSGDLSYLEMERALKADIEVSEAELRELAQRRAAAVRDVIISSSNVDPERIYLVQSQPLSPQEKEGVKESRVEFTLRD
ncbi:MAG: DUF748 domain-containing protein [Desulfobacteraceae bacterium]|nr:MAG: DUF748 domain-containing protein [Desulfobacteraceae bacterium]